MKKRLEVLYVLFVFTAVTWILCSLGLNWIHAKWDTGQTILIWSMILLGYSAVGILFFVIKDKIKWQYITYKSLFSRKRYWFSYGWIGIILWLNDFFVNNPTRWTIYTYDLEGKVSVTFKPGFALWPWKLYYKSNGLSEKRGDIAFKRFSPGDPEFCSWIL